MDLPHLKEKMSLCVTHIFAQCCTVRKIVLHNVSQQGGNKLPSVTHVEVIKCNICDEITNFLLSYSIKCILHHLTIFHLTVIGKMKPEFSEKIHLLIMWQRNDRWHIRESFPFSSIRSIPAEKESKKFNICHVKERKQ